MLQFCHGGSRRGAHPKLALTWPWSSVVHGRAPNLTCLNPQPLLGGTAEGVCVAGPLPGQPLHTQRRPWGAAPGCFETGPGSIKARFCNGCSRLDLKASRAVEQGLGNSGNGELPWGARADGAQSQRSMPRASPPATTCREEERTVAPSEGLPSESTEPRRRFISPSSLDQVD